MSTPKKIGVVGPGGLRTRAGIILAAIVAAGGISTSTPQGRATGSPAADRNAPTTVTRAVPGTQSETPRTTTPSSARLVGIERSRFTEPYDGGGTPGMDRKTWGMSSWCKQMRLQNVRKGRQPHYRPRAKGAR